MSKIFSENQSGGGHGSGDSLNIFPLRNEDLVFSKNRDGIVSCGYKVSNALLNATLGMPMAGGGGGGGGGAGHNKKHKSGKEHETLDVKTAKIMEDLVVPSSLYYCKPITKDKVFNYKKGKANKANNKKKESGSDSDSDDNVIDESLYDKLLSLVSSDEKVKYDKKTRKVMDKHDSKHTAHEIGVKGESRESRESGENAKIKNKTKTKNTRKVKFNV